MNNDETNESNAERKKVDIPAEGDKQLSKEEEEFNPVLAEAKTLAESILEGNKKHEDLLMKQERLLAEQALGGTSGGRVEPKTHIETPIEYRDRVEKEIEAGQHGD